MKRSVKIITMLLLISITINTLSAVEITLSKPSYQPGETLQVEIIGNFIDSLAITNIHLRKQGSPKSIPVEKELVFKYPKYYLYMTPLPDESEGVSLQIENTRYMEGGEVKSDNIIKEVIIQEIGTPTIYFNPGFVLATDDFTIGVKSLYGSQMINTLFEASGEIQNFYAIEDILYPITFSILEIETQTSNININGESIPIFISNELPPPEEPEEPEEPGGQEEPVYEENCSELNGEVCQVDWTCNQTEVETPDTNFCCLGICEAPADCVPNCTDMQCGGDGCGGSCGNCTIDFSSEFYCDSEFICINSTIPCIQRCEDVGAIGCFGDYLKTCGNFDIDNCFEWGNASLCTWGCENSNCSPEPGIIDLIFLSVSKTNPVLSASILPDKDYPFQVVLENIGTAPANNISIYTDFGFVVVPSSLSLNANQRKVLDIFINVDGTQVQDGDRLLGKVIAEVDGLNATFPIYLEITLNEANEIITGTNIPTSYTCAEQKGVNCPEGQECDLETVRSSDVSGCCIGKCVEPSSSGSWWVIGIILIGIVVVVVIIGVVKSKKQPGSPKSKLEERKKRFEQRMRPPTTPTPTSGSLGKV